MHPASCYIIIEFVVLAAVIYELGLRVRYLVMYLYIIGDRKFVRSEK